MEKIFRFKVTSKGAYSSLVPYESEYCTFYKWHDWVAAEIGVLLVFNELESAYDFISRESRAVFRLWLCECEKKVIMPPKRTSYINYLLSSSSLDDNMKNLWTRDFRYMANNPYLALWPENTESYQRIKLIKELNW